MRRFLLIMLAVLALPTFAQKDYQFRVSSFMSEDAQETITYNYADASGWNLQGIHEVDFLSDPAVETIDSLRYDNDGNIISLDTYQLLDGEWLKVCWVEYTYNEMGLRATRKNYNDYHDGWGPQLGGIYYYYYNDEGQMTSWELDFGGIIFNKGELTYNANGTLQAELIMQDPFTGVFENSFLLEYYYDENNNLVETHDYTWDLQTNDWVLQSILVQEYDEFGNCTLAMTTTPSGTPQEKRVYKYDDKVLAENIFFYPNPEDDFPTLPQMYHMLTSYEYWALDQTSGGLFYVIDYILGYEQIGEVGLSASISVDETEICLGDAITLNVEAYGGTGEYTYSWTPAELLNDAESQNPTATPTEAGEITFTVTVDDGLETAEASVTILVKDCTNVEENNINNISIYPNPAKDFITINSNNIDFIEVLDIYGRVLTSSDTEGETRIDMSNFANGIYYVRLHSKGETAVQKVVKN